MFIYEYLPDNAEAIAAKANDKTTAGPVNLTATSPAST